MEEREALKRQIELLQNLINKHKSVHGDTPFDRVEPRQPEAPPSARGGHGTFVSHPHSSTGRQYPPQSHGSWRKTYSLRNKNPQSSGGHPGAATSSSVHQSSSLGRPHSTSLPGPSREEQSDHIRTATVSSGISQQTGEGQISSVTGIRGAGTERETTGAAVSQESLQRARSSGAVLPGQKASGSSGLPSSVTTASPQSGPQVETKPALSSKTSTMTESKPNISTATTATLSTGKTGPPLSAVSKVSKQPSISATSLTSQVQPSASFLKKSKFTWVKSQNIEGVEPKQASPVSSSPAKAVTVSPVLVSKAGAASCSPSLITTSKKTPAKKSRKLSPVTVAPKTSKYKWVSSSAGAQVKLSRKSLSPRTPTLSQRALERGEATKKLRAAVAPSPKMKKGIVGSSSNSAVSSRYRWKAGGQSTSAAATGGVTVARRKSAFHWTSEKSSKGVRGGIVVSPSAAQRTSFTPSSSPAGFKLRSRMKIIRKSASSGVGSEKGGSPSAVKYFQRSRIHSSIRSPVGARQTHSRELVSYGRHKLRRLSPTFSRTSPASASSPSSSSSYHHRSPASQRTYRTRFKMVTRSSTTHALGYNPALSWRAKRIQTARSFLQSRLRAPHDRHPSASQRWRGSGMCWIGGSLYRVSANKLSRTVASNMSINRTGRSFGGAQVYSSTTPALSRPYSTRHLASRAVQRSLAIIRHARQKKPPKQYCMYYNRFGKCNRGNSCPYIHDPDKVAVCTRFLRGTCKQADGTCPFSHKVAKEKMPVCSYFLKGICNNSDCPYSHVYVSRKAEVCQDFVKGYCPEGEKCKKKHTLVCPDFSKTGSCPRGARCKLQHRQRAKRSTSSTTTPPAKRARSKEPPKRPRLSVVIPPGSPGTPTKGLQPLPSFISLSSSPEEADAPDTLPAQTSQVKERKLQIKPRL